MEFTETQHGATMKRLQNNIPSLTRPVLTVLLATLALGTTAALAQAPKPLGEFKDWSAFAYADKKNGKTCFMTSTPVKMDPQKVKHGDVYSMVTHRPKAKIRDEVSATVGYPFKARSEVTISIGKKTYKMYTSVDSAWSYDEADDRKLVTAMKAGDDMKVAGQSKRGTRVTYRFSLSGFTAAYKAISKACKKK
jgi:invasion protein IalB